MATNGRPSHLHGVDAMGKNEARRQKQLAKKKAKREDKRVLVARATSKDPTVRLADAGAWRIAEVLVGNEIWENGLGSVVVARHAPHGGLACAFFVVDVWCLGVKNCYWRMLSPPEFDGILSTMRDHEDLTRRSPEYAAKLVEGAVDYARSLGFAPNSDYRHARLLLAGIDPSQCPEQFLFGKDGKPMYIAGPHESFERARTISCTIKRAGGEFVIPVGAASLRG